MRDSELELGLKLNLLSNLLMIAILEFDSHKNRLFNPSLSLKTGLHSRVTQLLLDSSTLCSKAIASRFIQLLNPLPSQILTISHTP